MDTLKLHINNCKTVYNKDGNKVLFNTIDVNNNNILIDFDSLFIPYSVDSVFTDRYGTNNKVLRVDIEAFDQECNIKYQVLTSQAVYDKWKEERIIGSPSIMHDNMMTNRVVLKPFCVHQTFIKCKETTSNIHSK